MIKNIIEFRQKNYHYYHYLARSIGCMMLRNVGKRTVLNLGDKREKNALFTRPKDRDVVALL